MYFLGWRGGGADCYVGFSVHILRMEGLDILVVGSE